MKDFLRFLILTALTFSAEAATTYRFNRWTTNDDSVFTLTIAELNALHGITVVPSTRTLTINGTTFDLSANRTWTIPLGDVLWGTNVDGTITNNSNLGISIGASQKLYFGDASSGYLSFNSGSGAVVSSGPLTTPGLLSAASANVSGLTASRVVLSDGGKNLSSAAASGAVPINGDGSATTFPQVTALAPGNVVTQGYSFALTGSNATTVKVTSTTAIPLTLQTAASAATNALEIQDSTGTIKANIYKDGSQTNAGGMKIGGTLQVVGATSLSTIDASGNIQGNPLKSFGTIQFSSTYLSGNSPAGGITFSTVNNAPTTWPTLSASTNSNGSVMIARIVYNGEMQQTNSAGTNVFGNAQNIFTNGVSFAAGTNKRAGSATLVGGTVTVNNTSVVASDLLMLTRKTSGGTIGTAITYTLSAGTSFTITSDNVLDTSTFSWMLVGNP